MRPLSPRAWYCAIWLLGAAAPVVTSGMDVDSAQDGRGRGLDLPAPRRWKARAGGLAPPRPPPVEGEGGRVSPSLRTESRRPLVEERRGVARVGRFLRVV